MALIHVCKMKTISELTNKSWIMPNKRSKYENDKLENKRPTFYETWNSSEINIIFCHRLKSYWAVSSIKP